MSEVQSNNGHPSNKIERTTADAVGRRGRRRPAAGAGASDAGRP